VFKVKGDGLWAIGDRVDEASRFEKTVNGD